MSLSGFTAADLDVYEPSKWRSNVWNKGRLEVKEKLVALGRELAPGLCGLDGGPLEVTPSVEHPALWNHKQVEAQHLYFSRSEGSRKDLDRVIDRARSMAQMISDPTPQRTHIFLSVSVTFAGLEVALRLHPDAAIDRQNLARKTADLYEREQLVHLLATLPEAIAIGVTTGPLRPCREVTADALPELVAALERARPAPLSPGPWLAAVWSFPRAEVVARGAAIGGDVKTALAALLPLYWAIAWSAGNDYVSMKEALQKEKAQVKQRGLQKNDKVRIVHGVLTGKSGVVQDIDARGAVRLLVGKLAVKLDAGDLAKE